MALDGPGTLLGWYQRAVLDISAHSKTAAALHWPLKRVLRRGRSTRPFCATETDIVFLERRGGVTQQTLIDLPRPGLQAVPPGGGATGPHLAGGWGYGNLGDEAILGSSQTRV